MFYKLFITFLRIGTFTIGGGYAMIPLIQVEVVDKRHWLDEKEFLNMLALAQAAPGVIAVNFAILIGQRIYGWRGIIATVTGAILPSFICILLLATLFRHYGHLPLLEAIFKGVRPVVVAIIAGTVIKMGIQAQLSWYSIPIPLIALVLIWLANISPIWVILATIIITLTITHIRK